MNSKAKLSERYRYSLILLRQLVITEFKLRYQGSFLGYLWSLLRPLFLFVILYFVFVHFLRIGGDIPHWPVAMLLGIVLWNFFSEVTNNSLTSIVDRGDVIRKINFPKYVIILAGSFSAFINLLLNLLVIAVFMIFSGVELSWASLLSPVYILEIFVFALGLAFILSTVFVKLRDMNYIWEVIMQALFYASAVIYPLSYVIEKSPLAAQVMLIFNPVAQAIQDTRHTLISDQNPTIFSLTNDWFLAIVPIIMVILVIVFGARLFKRRAPYFAEEV